MTQEQLVEKLQEMKKLAAKRYHEFENGSRNQAQQKNKKLALDLGTDALKEMARLRTIHEILDLISENN